MNWITVSTVLLQGMFVKTVLTVVKLLQFQLSSFNIIPNYLQQIKLLVSSKFSIEFCVNERDASR